ncbi:MAG: class I SAM-dependent methyltransferase [Candidatus Paceibacterota bacterium]
MSLYSRLIFPRLCDFSLDQPFVAKHRSELLSNASGEVLEIGIGTGLNLPCYPKEVRRITAVDPNPGMHCRAQMRAQEAGIEVDKRLLKTEELPFDDDRFDCVVSTFTLCSIENVSSALGEIFRVLKPDGRFLTLEHGLSPEPSVQKWQRRLNWLQQRLADNCHLDRNLRQLLEQQPFGSAELDEFYLEKTPKTHGYLYRGVGTK